MGLEEEFEYYPDVSPSWEEGAEEKSEEERWWTPDLSWLQSEEEDEEEIRYLNAILSEKQDTDKSPVPEPKLQSRESNDAMQPAREGATMAFLARLGVDEDQEPASQP